MSDERPPLQVSCSFCGRQSAEVTKMVASHDAAICDECVGICLGTLDPDLFEATVEQARIFASAALQAFGSEPAV